MTVNRSRSSSWRAGAAVALLAIALPAACRPSASPAAARVARAERGEGNIIIGVAWPWAARREVRYAEGLEMAVDEINSAGGVRGRHITLRKEDDHESVDEGELVAQTNQLAVHRR